MTDAPLAEAAASVVIPAHNEATVIDRCLAALARSASAPALEVVVAANGCTDETVGRALTWQARLPLLKVLDLDAASKAEALNAGDASATAYPRVYLDADIELGEAALDHLLDVLGIAAPRVAAPEVRFDRAGAGKLVNLFYDAYEETPYIRQGLVGLGVYAMNEAGRARFGHFPALMADDLLVQLHFEPHERLLVPDTFTVRVPRSVGDLVRVRTRIARGNADLAESPALATSPTAPVPAGGTIKAVLRHGTRHPTSALVYLAVITWARLRARRHQDGAWLRDASTRSGDDPPQHQPLAVAYLVSQYPAPSHTFIEREIRALEQDGARITRISVRPTPPELLLSDVMLQEAAETTVIQSDPAAVARAAGVVAVRHPAALLRGISRSLRLGPPGLRSRVWQLFYFAEALRVRAIMRRQGVTHLHAHFANNSADIARHVAAISREIDGASAITWSFTMHGPTEFENVERHDLAAKTASADGVACITDFARSQLMRLSDPSIWPRLAVVPMGVDVDGFTPTTRDGRDGPLRVLFVGRLVPEKGPRVLVEAVRLLHLRGVNVEVTVVGTGPETAALQTELSSDGLADIVTLAGLQGQDEILRLYRRADAFCLPSFQEGLPVVLMEAMATGLPVVTTTIAGIPELVVNESTGLLVAPGRADLVANCLQRLSNDPELRQRLGAAARVAVVDRHATDVAGRAQGQFLRSLTAH